MYRQFKYSFIHSFIHFYPGSLKAVVVAMRCSSVSMQASILSGGRGSLGFPAVPSGACLRELLAATGGCSEAGFGGSQAAISAPAPLHQGCLAHRQTQFVTPMSRGK